MQSKAKTVDEYLKELPADRRQGVELVRQVILDNLDPAYEEGMQYGMIGYYVPHSLYPAGYHCDPRQPLPFACLASQKNHLSLYLTSIYGSEKLRKQFLADWAKTGKPLDMGKSCIRFKKVEDLALEAIGRAIRDLPARKYIEFYESAIPEAKRKKAAGRAKAVAPQKKAAKKKSAVKKKPVVKRRAGAS